MKTSTFYGHKIFKHDGQYYFYDTGLLVSETYEDKACCYCGLRRTKEGHDGCIGTIRNAMDACCGHGITKDAYIQWSDGSEDRGQYAVDAMKFINKQQAL